MIVCYKNQPQVVCQVCVLEPDGTSKTNISSALVRIYRISSGSEVDVLASTSLSQVESTNVFRYVWEPTSLAIGQYHIEYSLTDTDLYETLQTEELSVLNVPLWSDFELVRKVNQGRWRITGNQMIFYDEDDTTPILTFDLFDLAGNPTMTNVMERVPA